MPSGGLPIRRMPLIASICVASFLLAGCEALPKSIASNGSAATPAAVLVSADDWRLTSSGLLRTDDAGKTWHPVENQPAINYAWGPVASFPDDHSAWVCEQGRARGSTSGDVGDTATSASLPARCYVTGDGAKSWTQHDVPSTGTATVGRQRDDTTVNDIDANDSRTAWIVVGTMSSFAGGGHESISETELRLLHTRDSGVHWSTVRDEQASDSGSSLSPGGAQWVTLGKSGTIYANGFSVGIDRSSDSGRSWTTIVVPFPPGGEPEGNEYCSLSEEGSSLVVTERELITGVRERFYEASTDNGTTWMTLSKPASASNHSVPLC